MEYTNYFTKETHSLDYLKRDFLVYVEYKNKVRPFDVYYFVTKEKFYAFVSQLRFQQFLVDDGWQLLYNSNDIKDILKLQSND